MSRESIPSSRLLGTSKRQGGRVRFIFGNFGAQRLGVGLVVFSMPRLFGVEQIAEKRLFR